MRSRDKHFSWYTIDAWDSDTRRLAAGLLSGLLREGRTYSLSTEEPEEDFLRLVSDSIREDHFLVLDDFHLLDQEGEAHVFIQHVINRLPPNLHLVIISRRHPSIELARLRSAKELVEVNDEDLSFTKDEIRLFLQKIMRIPLPGGLFEQLYDLVGGWITGYVYLVERLEGLSHDQREHFLKSFIKTGIMPEIDEFFCEEVINNLPEKDIENLIELGALKQPNEELVGLITGEEQSDFLYRLWRNHIFITRIDSTQNKYSFDNLFYLYIQRRFQHFDRRKRARTVKMISEYYEKHKNYKKVVWYLLSVSEVERARDCFVKHADELYRSLDQDNLRSMLENFPESMREEEEILSYYYALSTSLVRPVTTKQRLLDLIQGFSKNKEYEKIATIYSVLLINSLFYQRSNEAMTEIVKDADNFIAEHSEHITNEQREILESIIPLGKWWTGNNEELAFRMALQAEETSFKFHNQSAYLCARLVLSRIYLEKGEFQEAKRLLRRTEVFLESHRISDLFNSLMAFYLGDTYFYLGELNTAVERIEQALKNCPDDFAFRYYLELNLILYNLYQEDISKAESLFELTENREIEENLYVKYFSRYLIQMLIAYRNKNRQRAEYFANRLLEPVNEPLLRTDFPYSYLSLAEVLIFLERFEDARSILGPILTESFQSNHPYPAAVAWALTALCREKMNDRNGLDEALSRMITIIREKEYRNLDIIDPELLNHLADLADDQVFSSFPRLTAKREKAARTERDFDLVIKTLGSFRFYIRGTEITTSLLSSQKRVMDLLKLLIVNRKTGVMKEKIYEIFWPRYSYKSARDNLNTIIYRLRKIFGADADFLATDVNMIYFKEGKLRTDLDDFREYFDRARAAENQGNLEAARSLYRMAEEIYEGDFLSGDLYLDFIRDQREELKNRYRQVLFNLVRITLSIGEYGNAIDWAKKLISLDTLCEPAYRLLMIASALSGNRSVIPQFYETLNRRLQEAYNLSADERTQALRDRLLYGPPIDSSFWEEERLI